MKAFTGRVRLAILICGVLLAAYLLRYKHRDYLNDAFWTVGSTESSINNVNNW